MAIEAQLFNGTILEFPDGTDQSVIQDVVRRETSKLEGNKIGERSWGEAATDVGASLFSGVGQLAQLPGQVGQLAGFYRPDEADTGLQGIGRRMEKFGQESKSEALKSKEQARAQKVAAENTVAGEFYTSIKETIKDPALFSSFFAEQIPNLIGSMGGGMLTKGAVKLALRGATESALEKAAVKGAVGTGAAMQGADIGSDTYEQTYNRLIKEGVNPEKANETALGAARQAAIEAAAISIGTAYLPGGTTVEKALVGRNLPRAGGAIKGLLGETLAEGVEEGGGKFVSNLAQQGIFPDVSLTKGVGEAAGMGALMGGVFGGIGGATLRNQLPETETTPKLTPPEGFAPGVPPEGTQEAPAAFQQAPYTFAPTMTPEAFAERQFEKYTAPAIERAGEAADVRAAQLAAEEFGMPEVQAPPPAPPAPPAPRVELPEDIEQTELVMPQAQPVPQRFSAEDIANIGDPKSSMNWFAKNVLNKSREDVQAIVDAKPELLEGKGARATILRGLLTPPSVEGTGQTLPAIGYSAFTPVVFPDGTIAYTPEQAAAYDEQKFMEQFDVAKQFPQAPRVAPAFSPAEMADVRQAQLAAEETPVEAAKPAPAKPVSTRPVTVEPLIEPTTQAEIDELDAARAAVAHPVVHAITEADVASAIPSGKVSKWMRDNVVGKTQDELRDMIAKNSHLIAGNTVQGQTLRKLTQPPTNIEFPNPVTSTTKAQGRIDQTVDEALKGDDQAKYRLNNLGAEYSPEMKSQVQAVRSQLAPALQKFGLQGVALELVDSIENGRADGVFFRNIMRIALDSENPMATMRHEVIHALKKTGAFTKSEWSILENKAREQWINQYFSPEMQAAYLDQYLKDNNGSQAGFGEYMAEEAIAEAFKHFENTKPPAGRIGNLFRRIKELLNRLRSFSYGLGFNNIEQIFAPEQVFRGIEEGRYRPMYGGADVAPAYQARSSEIAKANKEFPKNALRTNDWKATPYAVNMAKQYAKDNGIMPYLSEGQIDIPIDMPRYSIKTEGKYGEDPTTGLPINKNGSVTLYYHTTKAEARRINNDRKLIASDKDDSRIYLTNESSGWKTIDSKGNMAQDTDGSVVKVEVDPSLLQFDQEYGDGRKDFFIPVKEGEWFNKKMRLWAMYAERKTAIPMATKYSQLGTAFQNALDQYTQLDAKDRRAVLKSIRAEMKRQHNMSKLLGENGKLEKTRVGEYGLTYQDKSVASLGLGLASAQTLNEKTSTCPNAASCEGACLGDTSGNNMMYGGMASGDAAMRLEKTSFRAGPRLSQYLKTEGMMVHPAEFAIMLHEEISAFERWADKNDYAPAIRLNVTSDIPAKYLKPIMDAHPDVMFYDYTKLDQDPVAPNHHLTYSATGASQVINGEKVFNPHQNWDRMKRRLDNGYNVAMPFSSKTDMPAFLRDEATGHTYQVWDGDNYDARFLDPKREDGKGMIIGLTNKDATKSAARAVKESNGFFIDYDKARDGDTAVLPDQSKFEKKVIPIGQAKFSLRAPTTPEFKRWFADSKTVDENGNPQVLYTGTSKDTDFTKFRIPKNGVWLTSDRSIASQYAMENDSMGSKWIPGEGFADINTASRVMPVYAKIVNPYRITDEDQKRINVDNYKRAQGQFFDQLRAQGYDGVDFGHGVWVVLGKPEQIKSAIGNRGTFDDKKGDIRYSLRQAEKLAPIVQRNANFKRWFGNSKIVNADGKPRIMYHGTARDITEFKAKQAGAIFVTDDPSFAEDFTEASIDYMAAEYFYSQTPEQQDKMINDAVRSLVKEGSITRDAGKKMLEGFKSPLNYRRPYDTLKQIINPIIREKLESGQNILPVYVRAENPFDYENPKHLQRVGMQMAWDAQERGGDANPIAWAEHFAEKASNGNWEEIERDAVQQAIRNSGFDSFYIQEGGRKNLGVYSPNQIKSATGNVGTYGETGDIRYSFNGKKLDRLTKLADEKTAGQKIKDVIKEAHDNFGDRSFRTAWIDVSDSLGKRLGDLPIFDSDGRLRADYLTHIKFQTINLVKNGLVSGIPVVNSDGSVVVQRDENNLARAQIIADSLDTNSVAIQQGMSGRMLVGEVARILRGKDILEEDAQLRKQGRAELEEAKRMMAEARKLGTEGKQGKASKLYKQAEKLRRKGNEKVNINRELQVTPEHIAFAEHIYNTVPEVREVLDIFKEVNHGLVRLWNQVGLIDDAKMEKYLNQKAYVPLFKSAEDLDEDRVYGFRGGVGAKSTPKERRLEGSEAIRNIWENVSKQYAKMTALAIENQTRGIAASQLVGLGAAFETNPSDTRTNLRYRRDGKEVHIVAENPLDVAAFQSMNYQLNPIMKYLFGGATKALRWGALVNPMFWIRQLIRDPMHATLTTDAIVTPLHSTSEFVQMLFGRDRKAVDTLSARGVLGEFGTTMNIHDFLESVGKDTGKKTGMIGKAIHKVMQIHEAADAATRVAVYKQAYAKAIKDGMSEERATDIAVFKARESINFSVQGNSPTLANLRQMIPFLSATIVSLDTLYRAMKGHNLSAADKAAAKRIFWSRAMMMVALSTVYAMMYAGDDDYEEVPDYEKDNNWLIPIQSSTDPSKKSFVAVPAPFEIGFLFKTLPEVLVRYATGTSTGKEAVASFQAGLIHNMPTGGVPIPQAVRPILENITNHSFFTGNPIEGMSDQRKPVAMRGDRASETAKLLSKYGLDTVGLSPAKIDNLMRGYFAEYGTLFFNLTDAAINGIEGKTPPAKNFEDMPVIRSFMTDPTVQRSISVFYDLENQANQTYNQFNELKKYGKGEEIHDILTDPDKKAEIAARAPLSKIGEAIGKINQQIKRVQDDGRLTADQKRDIINKLKANKADLARKGVGVAEKIGLTH